MPSALGGEEFGRVYHAPRRQVKQTSIVVGERDDDPVVFWRDPVFALPS